LTPTLADIARAATTSISTASRVLSGGAAAARISQQTRERVESTARQLGYQPNLLARSLRTRRTHTAALLVSDIANPWFGRLASLIEQALHRGGYSLMLCNSGEDESLEREYLQLLPRKGIDGLILVPLIRSQDELLRLLSGRLPLVVLDRPIAGIPSVAGDAAQAAQLLCDRLAASHARRVGVVAGPTHIVSHRQRLDAVSRRFEVVKVCEGPAQPETGRRAAEAFRGLKLDAVVCTNNFLGHGYLEAMGESCGCVACFDEIAMMDLLATPLLCCMQDVPRLAEESVRMLLSQLSETGAPLPVASPLLLPSRVVCNRAFDRWVQR
jgi:LacI family transcriptional regulator